MAKGIETLTPADRAILRAALNSATGTTGKLKRAASGAQAFNPEDAPLSAATASTATAADGALTKTYSFSTILGVVKVTGGKATAYGSSYIFPVVSAGSATGNMSGQLPGTPSYNAWVSEVEFVTDTASKIQVSLTATTTYYYRVRVDGQYISKTPVAYTASGANLLTIDLSALAAGPHTIKLEINTSVSLTSIAVAPTCTVSKPFASVDDIVALCAGDSYTEGQGSTYRYMGAWVKTLGRLLGWNDVRQLGIGGTGYLTLGTAPQIAAPDQVATWATVNSDLDMTKVSVVTLAYGINDPGSQTSAEQAAALLTFQRARTACANALIIVFGAFNANYGQDAQRLANENAILAAFNAWADPFSIFIPVMTDPQPWLTGTGKAGATNGSGNSDLLIASDGTHPVDLGHAVLARRAAASIRAKLAVL